MNFYLFDKPHMNLRLALVLACSLWAGIVSAEEPFESFPHIQCQACLAIASHLGEKMNETAKAGATIQASHRLEHNNKPRREDYDTSELRAVEVMENMCTGIHNVYYLRITSDGKRFFSKNKEDKRSPFYGDYDKDILGAPSKRLETFCQNFADEHDEVVTAAIRTQTTLEGLQHQLCTKSLKLCGTKAVAAALEKEAVRREKYVKKRDARRKKAAAEKERKEEEERLAKEAAEKEQKEALDEKQEDINQEGAAAVEEPATEAAINGAEL